MEDQNLEEFADKAAALQASSQSKSHVMHYFMTTLGCTCVFCPVGSSATDDSLRACLTALLKSWMVLLPDPST